MKKILFAISICLLSFNGLRAQQVQLEETPPNWPVMLSNLNQSQITSGVLIDKVTTFANIINYNTTEKNFSNGEHFKQAINECVNIIV